MTPVLVSISSAGLTLASFLGVITVVVFFHELGHLLVGLWRGVKPEKFSIGFGPRLFGFMVGETEVRVSLLLFGGYVKFAGDNPLEEAKPEDQGRGFYQATPLSRGLIAVAGPAANFVLAYFLFVALYLLPQTSLAPTVGFVKPGSPAAAAGILPGDRITSVGGMHAQSFFEVQEKIRASFSKPIDLVLDRHGSALAVRVTPATIEEKNAVETQKQGRIGISAVPRMAVVAQLGPETPAGRAGLRTFDRIERYDGTAVGNYEELASRIAQTLSLPAAATPVPTKILLEGTRPREVPAPGGTLWVQEPLRLTLELPSLGRTVLPQEIEALAGIACADLNLFVIQAGSAAEQAGLVRGDRIDAVQGKPVLWWSDEVETERLARGPLPLRLEVLRDGKSLTLTVQQTMRKQRDESGVKVELPELGAGPDYRILTGEPERVTVRYGLLEAASRAFADTVSATRIIAVGLAGMVSGRVSTEAIGGPLMIADVARKAAGYGLAALLAVTASISVNLGLMNLLPLPVLDGFHLLSAILERIRRRPLSLRFVEIANMVGVFLLFSLMLFAMRNDVLRKFFE
jgi:regulator of sigma E protease